jgi:hypothetical protein
MLKQLTSLVASHAQAIDWRAMLKQLTTLVASHAQAIDDLGGEPCSNN